MVRMRGLEPRKQRPKRCVLPLHHILIKINLEEEVGFEPTDTARASPVLIL